MKTCSSNLVLLPPYCLELLLDYKNHVVYAYLITNYIILNYIFV